MFITNVGSCHNDFPECTGHYVSRLQTSCGTALYPEGSFHINVIYTGPDCVEGKEITYDGSLIGRCIDNGGIYTKHSCDGNVVNVLTCLDNQCQSGCTEVSVPLGQCTYDVDSGFSSQYMCTGGVANMVASLAVTALAGAAASFFAFF